MTMSAALSSSLVPQTAARPVSVSPVDSPSDLRAFVDLAAQIQGADPCFVPPLRDVQLRSLRKSLRGPERLQLFLAKRAGEVVGRIAVIEDRKHRARHGDEVVFFGFFEVIEDLTVVEALLAAARGCAGEWGAERIRGPRNLSRIAEIGALTQGHDTAPPMLAGHGPRYYAELLEQAGMEPHHDILAYEIPLVKEDGSLRDVPERMAKQIEKASAIEGLELRPASWWHILRDLKLAHTVFVEAFKSVPDNTPMSLGQWVRVGFLFLVLSSRHMLQIATVHGKPAGFALCFLDLNEAWIHAGGRLFPLGVFRFLRAVPRIRTASFKLLGVLPEVRSHGLHMLMAYRACVGVYDAGYRRLEASLVDGRNRPMNRMISCCDGEVYRRYGVFEQSVG